MFSYKSGKWASSRCFNYHLYNIFVNVSCKVLALDKIVDRRFRSIREVRACWSRMLFEGASRSLSGYIPCVSTTLHELSSRSVSYLFHVRWISRTTTTSLRIYIFGKIGTIGRSLTRSAINPIPSSFLDLDRFPSKFHHQKHLGIHLPKNRPRRNHVIHVIRPQLVNLIITRRRLEFCMGVSRP